MQNYQFFTPKTVEEALNILSEGGDGCKIIAGGTDLIPALRKEDILPNSVLNILEIDELKGITEDGDAIRIGPATSFTASCVVSPARTSNGTICATASASVTTNR